MSSVDTSLSLGAFLEPSLKCSKWEDWSLHDKKENKKDEYMHVLENFNLIDTSKANDSLKQKRKTDIGIVHAGGYAGYNDDESEELGGSEASMTATGLMKP